LGRALEAYPDEHGVVRLVLVRLKGREIKRPIHKLCLIQPSDENESANALDLRNTLEWTLDT